MSKIPNSNLPIPEMPTQFLMSTEKKAPNSAHTSTNNTSLQQTGQTKNLNKDSSSKDDTIDELLKDLPLINPLLYKPASKPPVIKEGDWLCPDPTCCNVNWAKRMYCNRCGIQRPNIDLIKNKTYMLSQ